MENKTEEEVKKVVEALNGFSSFAANMLNGVIKDAPEEEREKLKKEVDNLKKKGLNEIDSKIKEAEELLKTMPK